MVAATQVSTRKTSPPAKVLSPGVMVRHMKVTGKMESITERARRFFLMEQFLMVNGKTAYQMVLLYASIRMVVNMKENGLMGCIAVLAKKLWKTVPHFKAYLSMEKRKVTVRKSCQITPYLRVHGKETNS
jgi:hypothetical protein